MNEISFGKFARLQLSARPSFFISSLLLWALLAFIGLMWFQLPLLQAMVGGLVAVVLHWLTVCWHHVGHAYAARRVGYPMQGVRFGFLIAASVYPSDEPALPAAVHVARAFGGPTANFLLCLLIAPFVFFTRLIGGVFWLLVLFLFLDNLILAVQLFIPLSFNDGSAILYWLRKR
jgi:hypothetical protein